jgi:hypothetical protein
MLLSIKPKLLLTRNADGVLYFFPNNASDLLEFFMMHLERGADKSLARPTSRCILFDGDNISFDVSLVLYIYIVLIFLQL